MGRIESLPFEDNSIDTVAGTSALERIPDLSAALACTAFDITPYFKD